ncbi:MAG: hypothetical protein K6G16_06155 [Lachnospiraceae bacterium]|nr:hypothetical protein [Lachnospiraceae bacterium]
MRPRTAKKGTRKRRPAVETEDRMFSRWAAEDAGVRPEEAPEGRKGKGTKRRKKRAPREDSDWNEIVYSRDSMNMDDPAERREFVNACLQQMAEAQVEMDNLEFEYRTVTAYLHDLEEIDALPQKDRTEVARLAQRILDAGHGREQFYNRDVQMGQNEFERMHELEPRTGETIARMAEAEEYRRKVTNDLRRLDSEREAYDYRLDELERTVATSRVLMVFTAVFAGALFIALFVMSRLFRLEVIYGYLLTILFAALSVTVLYIRAQNAVRERKSVLSGISRLILLQNTVKIRYVNNQNLLNYMAIKYNVKNADEFRRLADLYEKEKDDRARLRGSEKNMMEAQRDLQQRLRNYRLQYPDVWMNQLSGLADPKEEVEIRHHLNSQRQSLRERMDYNERRVKGRAREEIERLARDYPEYADEILDMVARTIEIQ